MQPVTFAQYIFRNHWIIFDNYQWVLVCDSVADLGFPRGCRQPLGVPIYYLANFSLKLHENEEILDRGREASLTPPRHATVSD